MDQCIRLAYSRSCQTLEKNVLTWALTGTGSVLSFRQVSSLHLAPLLCAHAHFLFLFGAIVFFATRNICKGILGYLVLHCCFSSHLWILLVLNYHEGPRWQSGNTLASHLCGRGSIPVMAVSGKAGSCLPLVGSLQYRTLANYMYWFPLPFQLPVVI